MFKYKTVAYITTLNHNISVFFHKGLLSKTLKKFTDPKLLKGIWAYF